MTAFRFSIVCGVLLALVATHAAREYQRAIDSAYARAFAPLVEALESLP